MKLYLSSYGIGDDPSSLVSMYDTTKLCGVIANAQDHKDEATRTERLQKEMSALADLGIKAEEFDLRQYFDNSNEIVTALSEYATLWVRGGNVFILNQAMRKSGLADILPEAIRNEKVVYAGYSAGACVLAPNLHGIELVDDATLTPEGYEPEIMWDALNLLPYSIAPHYKSDHYESAAIDNVVAYFEAHHIPYKALRDGEAIVINDGVERIVGMPK